MSIFSAAMSMLTMIVLVTVMAQLKHGLSHQCKHHTNMPVKTAAPARVASSPRTSLSSLNREFRVIAKMTPQVSRTAQETRSTATSKVAPPPPESKMVSTAATATEAPAKAKEDEGILLGQIKVAPAKKHHRSRVSKRAKIPVAPLPRYDLAKTGKRLPTPRYDLAKTGKRLPEELADSNPRPSLEPEPEQRMPEAPVEIEVELDLEIPIWLDSTASHSIVPSGNTRCSTVPSFVGSV